MTSYFYGPLLGFDIESTGVDQFEDRIVTFSMVYSEHATAKPIIREWLIDPQIEIAEGASQVHGITTEYARAHGLHPKAALEEIAEAFLPIHDRKIPLVIYNAPFDTTMLWAEFERWNILKDFPYTKDQLYSRVIDPLVLDKACDMYRRGSRKLTDTARLYGYDLTNAHESTADVLATLHVARAMERFFKPEMTIELLQEFQEDAKYEQATSFQAYLRNKRDEEGNLVDPHAVIATGWPYVLQSG